MLNALLNIGMNHTLPLNPLSLNHPRLEFPALRIRLTSSSLKRIALFAAPAWVR